MGEKETKPFQLTFNGLLKIDFQGSRVTSDGGLILVREWDERLGLGKLIGEHLSDSRQGTNKQDNSHHCVSADGCVQSQWPEIEIGNSRLRLVGCAG